MSRYYFINENGKQIGPIEAERLLSMGVTRQTYVWTEGMSDWIIAGQVEELYPVFTSIPNSYPKLTLTPGPENSSFSHTQQHNNIVKPNTWLWLGICTTILCCLPFGIISIVYASKVDSNWNAGNYAEAIDNSNKARDWGIASALTALVIFVIFIFLFL